ncbi:alcohol dehydrogenase [Fusarium oxysporum f. sp. lycopersici MN25]|nr:alcohol dehydrogenase [Fusarium oxysporum f. sp. lycopersici MN25]
MSVKTAPRFSLGKNGPLVSRMGLGLGLGTMGLTRPTYRAIPIQGEIFAFLDHAYEAGVTFWDSADQTFELNTSYVYVKKACAESLRLLDIESIDLSYLHTPNPETPIEETMRALKELQDEGKIKCIGLSAVTSTTLRRAAKIAPVAAIQIGYSAFGLY